MSSEQIKTEILEYICEKFIKSDDFNGCSTNAVLSQFDNVDTLAIIKELINEEKIELIGGINPHIKRLPSVSIKEQISCIDKSPDLRQTCLYPHTNLLKEKLTDQQYLSLPPYTKKLKYGESQLSFTFFSVAVLDRYIGDPRYDIRFHDIGGGICVHEDAEDIESHDEIFIQSFGLSYVLDHDGNKTKRAVCVHNRYLHDLSPKHQSHWYSFEVQDSSNYIPDYDYYKASINGDFPKYVSIFDAFVQELKITNLMTKTINGKNLYREDFCVKRPREFSPFINLTEQSLRDSIKLLDKMFTDNVNIKFFDEFVDTHEIIIKQDGAEDKKYFGVLKIMETFFDTYFKPHDKNDTFKSNVSDSWKKKIKKVRDKDSHYVQENEYSADIHERHAKLIADAYECVRFIRLALTNHPKVRLALDSGEMQIPEWLKKGKIRSF